MIFRYFFKKKIENIFQKEKIIYFVFKLYFQLSIQMHSTAKDNLHRCLLFLFEVWYISAHYLVHIFMLCWHILQCFT